MKGLIHVFLDTHSKVARSEELTLIAIKPGKKIAIKTEDGRTIQVDAKALLETVKALYLYVK